MLKEYEVRSNTVQNALQLLANRMEAVKLRLGSLSLPVFGALVNAISWLVDSLSRLPAPIYAAVALAAGLAGAFLAGAGALVAFGGLVQTLPTALLLAKAGLATLKTALLATKGAFISAAGPVLALAALAALSYAAWKTNFGGIRDAAEAIAAGFRMAATASEEGIAKVDAAVAKKLKDAGLWDLAVTMGRVFFRVRVFVRGLVNGFKEGWAEVKAAWSRLEGIFTPAIEKGKFLLEKLGLMKGAADSNADSWERAGEILARWVPHILAIAGALAVVSKAIAAGKAAMALFNIVAAANPIGLVAIAVVAAIAFMMYNWDVYGKYIMLVWEGVKGIFGGAVAFFQGIWEIIKGVFSGNLDMIGEGFRKAFDGIKTFFLGWVKVILGNLASVVAPIEWILKKMGIIGDPKVKLANQIAGLDATEEAKQQLLARAKALDPETAGRVAEDFAGGVSAAKKSPEVMGMMLGQAEAPAPAAPAPAAPGAPAMPAMPGPPTDAPLADASASAKAAAAGAGAQNKVTVSVEPQPVTLTLDGEKIAQTVAKYQAKQETRRGGDAAYGY
jgi:hypothetical protein